MANRAIYFDTDEKLRKKFQVKCLLNGVSQKEVLEGFVKEYVYGRRPKKSVSVQPVIRRGMKGVAIKKTF